MMRFLVPLSLLALLVSCSDDEERLKIRRDIANLQEQIYKIEMSQKELAGKVDQAVAEIETKLDDKRASANQREIVETLKESLNQLEARMSDVESQRARVGSTSVLPTNTNPSEPAQPTTVSNSDLEIQFNTSYGDFTRGKYELAAYGFEELLNNFPNSPFSEQSYYYLGRCYFELKNWQKANQNFDNIVAQFPRGSYLKPSMLYQGQCFYYMNSHSRSVSRLQELVSKFPDSKEAELAKTFLRQAGYEK